MLDLTKIENARQAEIARRMAENPDLYDETGFPVRGTVRIKFVDSDLVRLARERYPEFDFDQELEIEFERNDIIHYEYMFVNVQKWLSERFDVMIKRGEYRCGSRSYPRYESWSIDRHFEVLNLDELEDTFEYYYEDEGWY